MTHDLGRRRVEEPVHLCDICDGHVLVLCDQLKQHLSRVHGRSHCLLGGRTLPEQIVAGRKRCVIASNHDLHLLDLVGVPPVTSVHVEPSPAELSDKAELAVCVGRRRLVDGKLYSLGSDRDCKFKRNHVRDRRIGLLYDSERVAVDTSCDTRDIVVILRFEELTADLDAVRDRCQLACIRLLVLIRRVFVLILDCNVVGDWGREIRSRSARELGGRAWVKVASRGCVGPQLDLNRPVFAVGFESSPTFTLAVVSRKGQLDLISTALVECTGLEGMA